MKMVRDHDWAQVIVKIDFRLERAVDYHWAIESVIILGTVM